MRLHLQMGGKKRLKRYLGGGKKLDFKGGAAFPVAGRIPAARPCRGWAGGETGRDVPCPHGGMSRVPTGYFGGARRKHKLQPFKFLSPALGLARSLCKGGTHQTPAFLVSTLIGLFLLLLLLKLEGSTLADPGERGSPRAAAGGDTRQP